MYTLMFDVSFTGQLQEYCKRSVDLAGVTMTFFRARSSVSFVHRRTERSGRGKWCLLPLK